MKFERIAKNGSRRSNGWDLIATEPFATAAIIGILGTLSYLLYVNPLKPDIELLYAVIIGACLFSITAFFTWKIAKKSGRY